MYLKQRSSILNTLYAIGNYRKRQRRTNDSPCIYKTETELAISSVKVHLERYQLHFTEAIRSKAKANKIVADVTATAVYT